MIWPFKPKPDRFARKLVKAIRAAAPDSDPLYDAEEFCIRHSDSVVVNLHNVFEEYKQMSVIDRRRMIDKLVAMATQMQNAEDPTDRPFDEIADQILPRLRSTAYYTTLKLHMQLQGEQVWATPYEPLTDYLGVEAVFDTPDACMSLQEKHFEEWGKTFEQVMEHAERNLRRDRSGQWQQLMPGLYQSPWQDTYDTTRMLLPEIFGRMDLRGDPVAIPVERNLLLVSAVGEPEGLVAMAQLAEQAYGELSRAETLRAFRLHDGRDWQPWLPEPGRPGDGDFQKLRVIDDAHRYNEQKDLLDQIHEKDGTDVFVATVMALGKDDSFITNCVWTPHCRSWLPRTDWVIVGEEDPDAEANIYRFDDLLETVGNMMNPVPDLTPTRYAVGDTPKPDLLANLEPVDTVNPGAS